MCKSCLVSMCDIWYRVNKYLSLWTFYPRFQTNSILLSKDCKPLLGPIYTWRIICRRIVDEYSTKNFSSSRIRRRRIFRFNFNFFCKTQFSSNISGLWICFRKKILKLIKIYVKNLRRQRIFLHWVFAECSLSIRRVFVDKFFAMCRWALSLNPGAVFKYLSCLSGNQKRC